MSPHKRIILNIAATYGRTVFGVLCGIFSTRWVLMALGKEDFGLYGLVGGLVVFISFFNTYFSGALSRFYAYAIGQAKGVHNTDNALEECRKWFSIGVAVLTLVPLLLVLIGYPIGSWAISSGKVGVPAYRIDACIWLWRFVCMSCFVGLVNIPFCAMYTAKQYIAELTIYSFAQTFVRTGFVYFMTLRQDDWLVTYGFVTCLIAIVPQVLICIRAIYVFEECRFRFEYLKLMCYVKKIVYYVVWQLFGGFGYLSRYPLVAIVVNRFFGPSITASFSIGTTVSGEAAALTGALTTAFTPAITTACGEGDWERLRKMAYQASKIGTLLTLFFAIPMALEISEILRVWLKEVPRGAEGICLVMLSVVVVDKFSLGHCIGVNASGRVALFQVYRGLACLTAMPFALVAAFVFHNVYAVVLALLMATGVATISNIWMARTRVGLSMRFWLFKIIVPLGILAVFTGIVGYLPHFFMAPSIFRVIVTALFTLVCEIVLSWLFVLDDAEREFLLQRLSHMVDKYNPRNWKGLIHDEC